MVPFAGQLRCPPHLNDDRSTGMLANIFEALVGTLGATKKWKIFICDGLDAASAGCSWQCEDIPLVVLPTRLLLPSGAAASIASHTLTP